MALPTLIELFGATATLSPTGDLTISADKFTSSGVNNPQTADALTLFGAIVKSAYQDYFLANTDQSVMANIEYSTQAPGFRNNLQKTQYNYNCQFFGAFTQPSFDPDDI
jgi:hypothetical protein